MRGLLSSSPLRVPGLGKTIASVLPAASVGLITCFLRFERGLCLAPLAVYGLATSSAWS